MPAIYYHAMESCNCYNNFIVAMRVSDNHIGLAEHAFRSFAPYMHGNHTYSDHVIHGIQRALYFCLTNEFVISFKFDN